MPHDGLGCHAAFFCFCHEKALYGVKLAGNQGVHFFSRFV